MDLGQRGQLVIQGFTMDHGHRGQSGIHHGPRVHGDDAWNHGTSTTTATMAPSIEMQTSN